MKLPTSNSSGNGYYGHETALIFLSEPQTHILNDEPPSIATDFSEYMWMEHEEEFDKQVMKQLEEEALMEQCIEAMLEDEHYANGTMWTNGSANGCKQNESNGTASDLCQGMKSLRVQDDVVTKSTLNPDAAEFVPTFGPSRSTGVTPPQQPGVATSDSKSLSDL